MKIFEVQTNDTQAPISTIEEDQTSVQVPTVRTRPAVGVCACLCIFTSSVGYGPGIAV